MANKLKNFIFYWFPLLALCIVIFVQSSYPSPSKVPLFPFADKLAHFLIYSILGILFFRAYKTIKPKSDHNSITILGAFSAGLYGISDEIHQHFVPSRSADIMDVMADIMGGIFGIMIYKYIQRKWFAH